MGNASSGTAGEGGAEISPRAGGSALQLSGPLQLQSNASRRKSLSLVDLTSTVTLTIIPGWRLSEALKVKINETARLVEVFSVVATKASAQSYFSTRTNYCGRTVLGDGWTALLKGSNAGEKKTLEGGESPAELGLSDGDEVELNCNLIIEPKEDIYPSALPFVSEGARKRTGFERLVYAVWFCQVERVNELLINKEEFDVNQAYTHGPLLSAYIASNLNTPVPHWPDKSDERLRLAEIFLRHPSTKINARDCYGRTAIQNAARDGNLKLFTLLLDSGATLKGVLGQIEENISCSADSTSTATAMKHLILDRYAGDNAEEDLAIYSIRQMKFQCDKLRKALEREHGEAVVKIEELQGQLKKQRDSNGDNVTSRKRKSRSPDESYPVCISPTTALQPQVGRKKHKVETAAAIAS